MRQLTLIRHAVTKWNSNSLIQGQSDVPLSAQGRTQARALGRRLAKLPVISSVHSSPLQRSLETARIALPGRDIVQDARLMELHFGVFQGRSHEENRRNEAWAQWHQDPFGRAAPEGESYRQLRERVVAWMESLPEVEHVVAFSHSGTIQMLITHVLGVEHPRWRKRIFLRPTSVSRILFLDDGPAIERVNDTRHLPNDTGDPLDD